MQQEDKATTTIPKSPAQEFITKVDARDRAVRGFEIAVLFVLVIFNIFSAIRLQNVIDQNQSDALVRSQTASQERQESKDYIKCILLIRYDTPAEKLTTRDGTEAALDACAKSSQPKP